jgi:rod shape-determining protein MreC
MRQSAPLFIPRVDWLVFLGAMSLSLALLFFGKSRAATTVKNEVGGALAILGQPVVWVRRTFDLWSENNHLRTQATTLSRENDNLRDAALENGRLRAMLNFRDRFPQALRAAETIGFVGTPVGGRVLINAGHFQGVRTNAAVLTPEGLVGKTVEVAEFTSLVQTLQGDAFGVSVMIERSRVGGILHWLGPNTWTIVGLSTGEDVKTGDLVVTTGFGAVFPKGIRVGVVTKVGGQDEPNKGWCRVEPFVRFETLEEVFVITGGSFITRADSLLMNEGRP